MHPHMNQLVAQTIIDDRIQRAAAARLARTLPRRERRVRLQVPFRRRGVRPATTVARGI